MTMKTLSTLLFALAAVTVQAQTNRVTLAWDPNSETNLAGYVVITGTNAGFSTNGPILFTSPLLTGTNYSLTNLATGPVWWFAVLARDDVGLDSDPSNEVSWKSARPSRPTGFRRVTVTVNVIVDE